MSSLTIYVLNEDFSLRNQRTGDIESLIAAVTAENLNYTLTPPPNDDNIWRWVETKWVKFLESKPILGFTNITSNLTYKTVKSNYTGETITYEGDRRINNVPS